ncbi:MAG: endolytic transglycosylase MltG [Pseudomonadota bacterium]
MRLISGVLTVIAIVLLLAGGTVFFLNHAHTAAGPLAEAKVVGIPRGEGRLQIASRLEQAGVISNRWVFIINHLGRSWLTGDNTDLKAGQYRFEAGAPMAQVLSSILSGRSYLKKLTFPEGLTSQQIVARINAAEFLKGEIKAVPGEGILMPDTYSFTDGYDRQAVLDRLAQAQKSFLARAWEKRQEGLPFSTPEEALILASIVEKETGQADERREVAAVFVNRLRKGMRLQSDPTIIYGIVGGKGSLGRPIYKSDIAKTTPYNTYRIDGLPPTPISNPGRASIEAVLNPTQSNALFFVADGTGGHKFSKTLAEHNKAVAQWRRIEKAARAKAAAAAKLKAAEDAAKATKASENDQTTRPASAVQLVNASPVSSGVAATQFRGTVPLPIRNPR